MKIAVTWQMQGMIDVPDTYTYSEGIKKIKENEGSFIVSEGHYMEGSLQPLTENVKEMKVVCSTNNTWEVIDTYQSELGEIIGYCSSWEEVTKLTLAHCKKTHDECQIYALPFNPETNRYELSRKKFVRLQEETT